MNQAGIQARDASLPGEAEPQSAPAPIDSSTLSARIEPFDSYWQAPDDIEAGYSSFSAYYRSNYLPHLKGSEQSRILVISCGPGYLVNLLQGEGFANVQGIDSDAAKIAFATDRGLNCSEARAFEFLQAEAEESFDIIIPEQELSHLTLDETIKFLELCRSRLRPGGKLISYTLSGANPLVGAENLAHNIDHFYTVTEYSYRQILELTGYRDIRIHPLKLYVFWKNPLNYVGLAVTAVLEFTMRVLYAMYGKKVTVLSKKIMATCVK